MEALQMESGMDRWNDDRLDELNGRVKDGFAGVDERFDKVEKRFDEVDERFVKVDQRFEKMGERFDRLTERFVTREEMGEVRAEMRHLNERFDRLYYTLLVALLGLVGTVLVNGTFN
jgi:predicted nuclease with TOPRIM domain